MKHPYIQLVAILFFAAVQTDFSRPNAISPGKDRWDIKTSLITNQKPRKIKLEKLLDLANPIKKDSAKFDSNHIPYSVSGFKEGDLVTTSGWFKLVAFESQSGGDGDYHIQLRTDSAWADTCFIVEIPMPEFIKNDPALLDSCKNARGFVSKKILLDENAVPLSSGNVVGKAYVSVTGALFFDAHHINANPPRGKKGKQKKSMSSYTCWEIHPVTHIEFAQKQK